MTYSLTRISGDTVCPGVPGPAPAMGDIMVVRGQRYRVVEVERRVSDSYDGERCVEVRAVVVEADA